MRSGCILTTARTRLHIHCDSSYRELVSGVGAESGTAPIQEMVGAARSGCPRDKSGACSSGGGGGGGDEDI